MTGGARAAGFFAGLFAALVVVFGGGWATSVGAADTPLWERVATPEREQADRLVQKAKDLLVAWSTSPAAPADARRAPVDTLARDNPARAEELLRRALALERPDFSTLVLLAEVQALRGHDVDATATLERAEPLAVLPTQKSTCWFRLGVERSRLGRYAQSLASYEQQMALGEAESAVYANAAELLMALGHLGAAEDRYREAIRIDERAGDRRGHEQGLAFSYYGLGVALDRDHQEIAAREAMGRAVTLDPNASMLRLAQQPGADIVFYPDGDVFYYLGLASEAAGRRDDAAAAFQEYLSRQPRSPWTARARVHLTALSPARAPGGDAALSSSSPSSSSSSSAAPGPPRHRWSVLAIATVRAEGPVAAPLIDAALKQRPPAWEACLSGIAPPRGHQTVRLVAELELDARGAVSRASVKLPEALASSGAGPCLEAALQNALVVSRPAHPRPTNARVEVLLANGDSAGL